MKTRFLLFLFTCAALVFPPNAVLADDEEECHCGIGDVSPTSVECDVCDDQIEVYAWAPITCGDAWTGIAATNAVFEKVVGEEKPTVVGVTVFGTCSHGTGFSASGDIDVVYSGDDDDDGPGGGTGGGGTGGGGPLPVGGIGGGGPLGGLGSGGSSGGGSGGGGSGSGGSAGNSSGSVASQLHWQANLGKAAGGRMAGRIVLDSVAPNALMYSPSALSLAGLRLQDVAYVPFTNRLSQILTAECFVNITVTSPSSYDVAFYTPDCVASGFVTNVWYNYETNGVSNVAIPNDVLLGVSTNTSYAAKAGTSPFVTYTFENPNPPSCNGLRITENRSGTATSIRDYTWTGFSWSLSEGGGLRTTQLAESAGGGNIIKTLSISAGGRTVSSIRKTYATIGGQQLPLQIVKDPAGKALTTTLTYFTNASDTTRFGRLKTQTAPDGSWETKDYNSRGYVSETRTGWLDGGPEDACRVTTHAYTPFLPTNYFPVGVPYDDGKTDPGTPRVETVSIVGVPVSKTIRNVSMDTMGYRTIEEVRLLDPAETNLVAAWEDPANPHTISQYMPENDYKPCSRQPELIIRPDGSTAHYDYIDGYCTNGVDGLPGDFVLVSGGPHFRTTITYGTKDSITVSPDGLTTNRYCGVPGRTAREVIIATKSGKTEFQRETYVCSAPDTYARVSWSTTTRDDLGRVVSTRSSNGTGTEMSWAGKRLAYEIGADGIRTDYTYDALGRRIGASAVDPVSGLTRQSLVSYDAEGRTLSSTISSGGLSQTSTNAYDGAGRLVWARSPDGLETAYDYGFTAAGLPYTSTIRGYGTALAFTNTTVSHIDGQIAYTEFNGTRKTTYAYGYDAANPGVRWTYTYDGPLGENSPVWTCSISDALGRTIEERRPGFGGSILVTSNSYNTAGQLLASTQSSIVGSVSSVLSVGLYSYDALGEAVVSAQDIDLDGQIDFAGPDIVSSNATAYVAIAGAWWRESRQYAFPDTGSTAPLLVTTSRQRLSGLGGTNSTVIGSATLVSESLSIDALGNTSTRKSYLNRDAHATASVSTTPASTLPSYSIAVGGLSLTNCMSSGIVSSREYDALGRAVASTDGRGNTSTVSYDAQGRVAWSEDALGNRTTLAYDALGRQVAVTNALGQATYTAYDAENRVVSTWGATYPVAYAYDVFGRMTSMYTYRGSGEIATQSQITNLISQMDRTTWLYDEPTGLLTNKVYTDSKGPVYTYTPDGKLATRAWARTVPGTGLACQTIYAYNSSGQLTGIDYSDTTPDVAFTYDRLGRQLSAIAAGVSTNLYAYSRYGQLTNEVVQGLCASAPLRETISRAYDTLGRSAGLSVAGGGDPGSPYAVEYGYDAYGRFAAVSSADNTYTYSYLPGANMVSGMTASSGHSWQRTFEPQRNLISLVENTFGETVISRFDYVNDEIGRRTEISRSGTAFDTPVRDAYGYNARSEVTSARRALASNPNQEVRGFSYDYAYDPIGNRITSKEYDHEDNARVSSYTANALNQYSQRSVPGYAGVRGSATNNATVTVNGNTAWRLGEYFYGGDDAGNAASAVMKELDITAVVNPTGTNEADLVQSVTGKVFVAKSPEAFTYDDDGNMLSDGRFVYTWDGENRLASIETSDAAASAGASRVKVVYTYDHRSRRIGKAVSHFENDTWTVAESRSFVYANWKMIQEIQCSNIPSFHSCTNSYVWGLDLSGSLQGAGGVGGLLAVISPLPLGEGQGEGGTVYLPCYDGNGNVMEYVSTDGTIAAHYEYSPFGETVIQSGDQADAFTFRFSTKYWENEAKLYYYGYRFYAPAVGRWLNRDPIGENGGVNIFASCGNNMLTKRDAYGRETSSTDKPPPRPEFKCMCSSDDILEKLHEMLRKAKQKSAVKEKIYSLYHGEPFPMEWQREYAGYICCNPKTKQVSSTGPFPGEWEVPVGKAGRRTISNPTQELLQENQIINTTVNITDPLNIKTKCISPSFAVAFYHSHPDGALLSPDDIGMSGDIPIPIYVVSQDGKIQFTSGGTPSAPYPIPPEPDQEKE